MQFINNEIECRHTSNTKITAHSSCRTQWRTCFSLKTTSFSRPAERQNQITFLPEYFRLPNCSIHFSLYKMMAVSEFCPRDWAERYVNVSLELTKIGVLQIFSFCCCMCRLENGADVDVKHNGAAVRNRRGHQFRSSHRVVFNHFRARLFSAFA